MGAILLEQDENKQLGAEISFLEKLRNLWNQYGIPTVFFITFIGWTAIVSWQFNQWMQTMQIKAEQNLEIGILKEKIDNLIKLQKTQCNP